MELNTTPKCKCIVSFNLWVEFSSRYAQAAKGTAMFLTDGESERGGYNDNNFFSQVEMKSMTKNIKRIVTISIHRKGAGVTRRGKCNHKPTCLDQLRVSNSTDFISVFIPKILINFILGHFYIKLARQHEVAK